jgi:RNA polymerase sigma-70 factor, ECF subfamily
LATARLVAHATDPFERVLRSIEGDALPLERVGSADTRMRASDAEPAPDLAEFVTQHYQRLIRLAALVTRNTADAEDAVQAALERAWKRRSDLRDPRLLKQWLDRIVVNEANRISGSRVRRLARLFTGADMESEEPVDVPDSRGQSPLEMAEMRQAFTKLSSNQRTVVILHLYAGYSVAETAAVIGAPLETIRSRLRLARQKLRTELESGR